MTVEAATSLHTLNVALPDTNDEGAEGDDHLRLIKSVLKATFPKLGGAFHRTSVKSAGFTPGVTDNHTIFVCSTTLTVTLPALAGLDDGTEYFFEALSGATVTLDPNLSETINGNETMVAPPTSMLWLFKYGLTWHGVLLAGTSHEMVTKTVLSEDDEFPILDSEATWAQKRATLFALAICVFSECAPEFASASTLNSNDFFPFAVVGTPNVPKRISAMGLKSYTNANQPGTLTGKIHAHIRSDYDSTTSIIAYDDSVPQISEGKEFLTYTFTPDSAFSKFLLEVEMNLTATGSGSLAILGLFLNGGANAVQSVAFYCGAGYMQRTRFSYYFYAPPDSGELTFSVRAGQTVAGTLSMNGVSGARKLGGTCFSFLRITEMHSEAGYGD
jgi:hypothetical protein